MSAQSALREVTLEERIRASVAAAPPFTDEQEHLIRTLLAPRLAQDRRGNDVRRRRASDPRDAAHREAGG